MRNIAKTFSFNITPDSPSSSSNEIWGTPKLYTPSKIMHHLELGQLDPSLYMNEETEELYEQSPGHLGRIWFTVLYNKDEEELKITLIKVRNLRVYRDPITGHEWFDFSVKIILGHDERRCHVTSVKKKNCNQNINETFAMQVPMSDIETQSIHISINCIDKHKHQKAIGTTIFDLKCLKESFDKSIRVFRDLEEVQHMDQCRDSSELLVALTYNPALERLTVGLFDVKKLPLKDKSSIATYDIYAEISLHQGLQCRLVKCKKSSTLCHGRAFNESFTFTKITDLEHISIRVTLHQQRFSMGIFNKPLGFIVLGSDLFSKRRELEHWQEMMGRPNEQVCYWHSISLLKD